MDLKNKMGKDFIVTRNKARMSTIPPLFLISLTVLVCIRRQNIEIRGIRI
jgi:hypothetical protein